MFGQRIPVHRVLKSLKRESKGAAITQISCYSLQRSKSVFKAVRPVSLETISISLNPSFGASFCMSAVQRAEKAKVGLRSGPELSGAIPTWMATGLTKH